jgi:hypothetical protein
MNTRPWGIALVLVLCAAAIGCVTYQYPPSYSQPSYSQPVSTEPAVNDGSDQPFYDDLEPYGRWVYVSGPGWVWSPYGVQATWRPYQVGHWVYTDYGWTWASDESWGWATYHYGRWNQDPSYGWVWVPGTEWGPAWVAWHEGGGYVGWAPLPWQVHVEAGIGIDWANVTISSNWWSFTATRYLVDPGLRTHIVPQARNVSLVQVTQNVTNYTYIDNRIVNNGVKVEKVGRACGRTIPRYHVAETDAPEVERGGKVRGQDFVVFRPEPGRGRKSRGRPDPPGQEVRERAHDFRDAREDARNRNRVAPPPQQEPAVDQPPSPPAPPANENGQGANNRDQRNHENRGRKYYDDLMGRQQPPRHGPQRQAPDQSAPPDQQRTTPPPAENRPSNPPPGEQHGPATPPARVEPPQRQTAREKTQEARDAAARGRKPKKDEPKSNENKPDEPKDKKPDSEN